MLHCFSVFCLSSLFQAPIGKRKTQNIPLVSGAFPLMHLHRWVMLSESMFWAWVTLLTRLWNREFKQHFVQTKSSDDYKSQVKTDDQSQVKLQLLVQSLCWICKSIQPLPLFYCYPSWDTAIHKQKRPLIRWYWCWLLMVARMTCNGIAHVCVSVTKKACWGFSDDYHANCTTQFVAIVIMIEVS